MNKVLSFLGLCLLVTTLPAQRNGGPIRPGPWTAAKIPPGWIVHSTKNYQVQSQAGIEKAKRLGEHMEVMLEVYRKMFKTDKTGAKQQAIKLFKEESGMHAYNPEVPGAAAYYSWTDRELVCYDTGKWGDEPKGPVTGGKETPRDRLERRMGRMSDMMTMDLLGCAAHEGWHQYFHWYVGSVVQLPSWINEGMGDYFYTAAPKETKGKKIPAELGRLNDYRLVVLKAAVRQDRFVPLAQLLPMLQQQFYANASVCYAEGWALCQFLLHGAGGKYAKVIPSYINLVKNDTNVEAVTAKAFKGIDIAVMEAEFRAWIDGLKVSDTEEEDEADGAVGGAPAPPGTGEGTPGTPPAPEPGTSGGTPPGGTPPAPTPAPGAGGGTPPAPAPGTGGTPPPPTPAPGTGGGTPPGGTPPAPTPTPGGGGTPPGGNGG